MKIEFRRLLLSAALLIVGFAFLAVQTTPEIAAGTFISLNCLAYGLTVSPNLGAVNSLGTLSGELILRRALAIVFTKVPQLQMFTMGFKDLDGKVEGALLGQTVRSRTLSLATIGNFGDAANSLGAVDVSGQLRNNPQLMHMFTPAEYSATDRTLIEESAQVLAASLGRGLVRRIAALANNANFSTITNSVNPYLSVASGWSRANTILPLQQMCQDRGMPIGAMQPFFLYDSGVQAALLGDQTVVTEFSNSRNNAAISTGVLPTVSGFAMDSFPLLSSVNGDGNLIGLAGTPDSIMYLARAPKSPNEVIPGLPFPGIYGIITEPKTGFSIRVTQWVDPVTMNVYNRLDWLDGLEVGNPNNLIRLVNGVIAGSSGTVVALTTTNAGYASVTSGGVYGAPTLGFSGGGGASAAATVTVSNNGSSPTTTGGGAVNGSSIGNAGTGYTSAPTIAVTKPSGGSLLGTPTVVASVGGLN